MMRLLRRKPKAVAPPSTELPAGEEVERATAATLLQGKSVLRGSLFLTNRRLLFEATKGDARWMSVPFAEIKSAGLYPWPRATLGAPSSRQQCLVVETARGEQVWWDFGERDEREWLPIVKQHVDAASGEEGKV
ncbi:MAG: GRAM domain-containing protein [Chloroflexota bacterium]|nr:GRAM domain-containing protein [Chloroflexota bacterium]